MKKLTMVSVWYRGKRLTAFVETVNGVVNYQVFQDLQVKLDIQIGDTFTIG